MVKNNRIVLLTAILIATAIAAAGTIALLSLIDKKEGAKQSNVSTEQPQENTSEENETGQTIDEQKNRKALAIDKEATGLMESDPSNAKEKFSEAESTYREAGNELKASEMNANAMTAQLLAEQKSQQEN